MFHQWQTNYYHIYWVSILHTSVYYVLTILKKGTCLSQCSKAPIVGQPGQIVQCLILKMHRSNDASHQTTPHDA